MAKKIVSVALAAALLLAALLMLAFVAYNTLGMVENFISLVIRIVDGGFVRGLLEFHYYHHGHFLHNYLEFSVETLTQNLYSNESYLNYGFVCFAVSTIRRIADLFNDAAVMVGFFALALLVLSSIIKDKKGILKSVSKILLIASFAVIFVSNLTIGFTDSAVWISTVISMIWEISDFGMIFQYIFPFIRFNLWKIDNYVYALIALLGAAYLLVGLFSKKSKINDAEKISKEASQASAEDNFEVSNESENATSDIAATDGTLNDEDSEFFIVQK